MTNHFFLYVYKLFQFYGHSMCRSQIITNFTFLCVTPRLIKSAYVSNYNMYAVQLWYKISFQNSTHLMECSRYPHPQKSCTLEVLTQVSLISFIRNYLTLIVCSHCVKRVQIRSFSSPNVRKYRPEKTLYLNTFHAVSFIIIRLLLYCFPYPICILKGVS